VKMVFGFGEDRLSGVDGRNNRRLEPGWSGQLAVLIPRKAEEEINRVVVSETLAVSSRSAAAFPTVSRHNGGGSNWPPTWLETSKTTAHAAPGASSSRCSGRSTRYTLDYAACKEQSRRQFCRRFRETQPRRRSS